MVNEVRDASRCLRWFLEGFLLTYGEPLPEYTFYFAINCLHKSFGFPRKILARSISSFICIRRFKGIKLKYRWRIIMYLVHISKSDLSILSINQVLYCDEWIFSQILEIFFFFNAIGYSLVSISIDAAAVKFQFFSPVVTNSCRVWILREILLHDCGY